MAKQSRRTDTFVSVVAPLQDDADIVTSFVAETAEVLKKHYTNYELVLVDNGSRDETITKIKSILKKHACIRVLRLSQAHDRETAIFAGLEASIGDIVVAMLPDSDPPKLIRELVELVRLDHDIVYGVSKKPLTKQTTVGRRLFYWYSRRFLQIDTPRNATYFIALNRRAVNALTKTKGRYRHVRQLARQVGFVSQEYRYTPKPSARWKDRSFFASVSLAMEIAVSYSRHPLRFVSWLGLFAGLLNILYALYAVGVYLFSPDVVPGWTTLSLENSVMFFLVFIILVVISEYVGRILEETRDRPPYHLMEELYSNDLIADSSRRNVAR